VNHIIHNNMIFSIVRAFGVGLVPRLLIRYAQ